MMLGSVLQASLSHSAWPSAFITHLPNWETEAELLWEHDRLGLESFSIFGLLFLEKNSYLMALVSFWRAEAGGCIQPWAQCVPVLLLLVCSSNEQSCTEEAMAFSGTLWLWEEETFWSWEESQSKGSSVTDLSPHSELAQGSALWTRAISQTGCSLLCIPVLLCTSLSAKHSQAHESKWKGRWD